MPISSRVLAVSFAALLGSQVPAKEGFGVLGIVRVGRRRRGVDLPLFRFRTGSTGVCLRACMPRVVRGCARLKEVVMLIIDHDEDGTVGVVLTHGLHNERLVMGSQACNYSASPSIPATTNGEAPTQASRDERCACITCQMF